MERALTTPQQWVATKLAAHSRPASLTAAGIAAALQDPRIVGGLLALEKTGAGVYSAIGQGLNEAIVDPIGRFFGAPSASQTRAEQRAQQLNAAPATPGSLTYRQPGWKPRPLPNPWPGPSSPPTTSGAVQSGLGAARGMPANVMQRVPRAPQLPPATPSPTPLQAPGTPQVDQVDSALPGELRDPWGSGVIKQPPLPTATPAAAPTPPAPARLPTGAMRPGILAQRSVAGPAAPAKPGSVTSVFQNSMILANPNLARVAPGAPTIPGRERLQDRVTGYTAMVNPQDAALNAVAPRAPWQPNMDAFRPGQSLLADQAIAARRQQLQRKQEDYGYEQQLGRAWESSRAFGSQGGLREPPPAYREYLAQAKAFREGRGPWPGPWRGSIGDRPLTASPPQAVQQPARQLAQASRPSPKSLAGGSSATQPTPAAVQAIQQQLTSDPAWTAIPAWAKQRYLQNYRAGRTQMNPQQALQYWQQHYANRLAV